MKQINVTQTFLPPIQEYTELLKKPWENKWLTNRGGLVLELENKLKKLFKVEHLFATTNGTIPIQLAIKLFGGQGEIITAVKVGIGRITNRGTTDTGNAVVRLGSYACRDSITINISKSKS